MKIWKKPIMLIASEQQIHAVIAVAARSTCRRILR